MGKIKAEYIWMDGHQPTSKLRSKTKIIDGPITDVQQIEKWGFDGAECICNDEDNNEYDCWNKTIPGDYSCSGIVRGGDCLDSYGRIKPNGVGFSYRKNKLSLNIFKIIAEKKRE